MRYRSLEDLVNLKKLTKRLRREAAANPKKTAVLGLLVVVALWFWSPLVWGWIAPDDEQSVAEVGPTADATSKRSPTQKEKAQTPEKPQAPKHPWRQLVKWMEDDPRTSPASLIAKMRDPFSTPQPKVAENKPKAEAKPPQEEITPESLALTLSSTVVGGRRRVAQINGKTFEQGKSINVSKDGQQYRFKLLEVYSRRVVLQRDDGERYELKIPAETDPNRIEWHGSTR